MSFDAAKPFHEGREKWSEERISELKRLHQLGFSAGQIAKHIGGATRNAVIGKINRLGLLRYKTINKSPLQIKGRIDGRTTRKTRRTAINLKPKAIIAALPDMAASPDALCIALLDLKPGMCRWPVGDGPVQLFCGHAQCDEHSPYCKDHHVKAHMPYVGKRKKLRAPREHWDGDWHPFGMSMRRAACAASSSASSWARSACSSPSAGCGFGWLSRQNPPSLQRTSRHDPIDCELRR